MIYSTTNGTVAMGLAAPASRVYCGALLNARALVEHIVTRHPGETVLIVCSGSGNNFNFEDFYGAGYFVECLLPHVTDLSDAAKAALALYRHAKARKALLDCRVGRMMAARGLAHEVEFACRRDAFPGRRRARTGPRAAARVMRVLQLYVYPVKGCRAVAVDEAALGPLGLEHDRRFAFVDADGRAVTQRDQPLLATIGSQSR